MTDNVTPIRPRTEKERARNKKAAVLAAAALRLKNNKPASGVPASGAGWGGPAKGAGGPGKREGGGHPTNEQRELNRMTDEAIAQEAKEKLVSIMRAPEFETNGLNAAKALLDRIEGTPVQRTITDNRPVDTPVQFTAVWPKKVND